MKKIFLTTIALLILVFISCKKESQFDQAAKNDNNSLQSKSVYGENNSGHIKIAVVSDIHYLDPSLLQNNGASGTAFQAMLLKEPYKVLLEYSPEIFSKVLDELMFEKPDIVLVTGDMVKDGEKIGHQQVSGLLNQLRTSGMKVYVIPGNNDINNPDAVGYNGNSSYPVATITAAEYLSLYGNFGYNAAIATDPNSFSYVAEPFPGLRILAIDACRYAPIYHRSGTIKAQTMTWIKQQMELANQNNITVIGMMHHNLIEHFSDQPGLLPYTVVEDMSANPNGLDNNNWKPRADSLMAWGLKVILTGHTHTSDVTARSTDGKTLYDIATGSLVTPPTPYRILVLKNKDLEISTNHIKSINASLPNNQTFVEYSNQFLSSNMDAYFKLRLPLAPFSVSPSSLVDYTVPLARNAYMAHIAGDENISPLEQRKIDSLNNVSSPPAFTIWALNTLWTDVNIKDGKWHIDMK